MEAKRSTFIPAAAWDGFNTHNLSARDKKRIRKLAVESWSFSGFSISIEGERFSRLYHPQDSMDWLRMDLEDMGYKIPKELDSWLGIKRWVKANIPWHAVFVPHLQAKRKWGYAKGGGAYVGRKGFLAVDTDMLYTLANSFYKEVIDFN